MTVAALKRFHGTLQIVEKSGQLQWTGRYGDFFKREFTSQNMGGADPGRHGRRGSLFSFPF
jgi:hypothetical protein